MNACMAMDLMGLFSLSGIISGCIMLTSVEVFIVGVGVNRFLGLGGR